ncbi:MAG: hypothetical protein KJ046_13530 [Anaerolineae bacterium]|nr:hypothetical protein [Anaerolineae bacterium]
MADTDNQDSTTPSGGARREVTRRAQHNFWRRPKATAEELTDRRIKNWAELWATIILSIATLITAWAGYEAGKWSSLQTGFNLRATALRIDAGVQAAEVQQQMQVDVGQFTSWVNAIGEGNQRLADFHRERFSDTLRPAFDAWLATDPLENPDAPANPFEMEIYELSIQSAVNEMYASGEELVQLAEVAGGIADRYTLMILILAGALLLAGLAHRFEWAELRLIVVGVALLILLYCTIVIIRLPMV